MSKREYKVADRVYSLQDFTDVMKIQQSKDFVMRPGEVRRIDFIYCGHIEPILPDKEVDWRPLKHRDLVVLIGVLVDPSSASYRTEFNSTAIRISDGQSAVRCMKIARYGICGRINGVPAKRNLPFLNFQAVIFLRETAFRCNALQYPSYALR